MEDTIIIKTQFAYMLRIDIPPSPGMDFIKKTILTGSDPVQDNIKKWVNMYNCTYYLGKLEKGEETGKFHYQMIVWFEQKLSAHTMTKLRNWWQGKTGDHKNSHAFTSARKVASLAAYSTKEKGELFTNLSDHQLKLIPKWQNKKAIKLAKDDEFLVQLENKLLSYSETIIKSSECHYKQFESYKQGLPDFDKYCEIFNECHVKVYGKSCCYRNKYFRLALKYDIINFRTFLIKIGVKSDF